MPVHIHGRPMSNIKIDKPPKAVEKSSGKIVDIGVEVLVQKLWCRSYDDLKWWLPIIYYIDGFFLLYKIQR